MDFLILRLRDYNLFQCYYNLKESLNNLIDNKLQISKKIFNKVLLNVQIKRYNFLRYFYIHLNNIYFQNTVLQN